MPVTVLIDPALMRELEESLNMGPMLNTGRLRMLNEEQVARLRGCRSRSRPTSTRRPTSTCVVGGERQLRH